MTNQKTPKIFLGIIVLVVLLVLIGVFYYSTKSQKELAKRAAQTSPSPTISIPLPEVSPAKTASPSPNPSPSVNPSTSADIKNQYHLPQEETFIISSKADTNGDSKEETLVVTQITDSKYHLYIFSAEGAKLYDNQDLAQKPVRISTQKYKSEDNYVSWMLIFTEQSGNLAFIRWNGTKYEIPQEQWGV